MKLKNILTSFAAAAVVLAGCTEKLPVELDVIKLDRSYVPLAKVVNEGEASKIEELDNVVNLTATVDWKIDSETIPAGLEVSPTSGTAGAYKLTFTRAEKGKDDISGEIRIDAAGRVQFIKVFYPGDPALKPLFPAFEAGDYWIMFNAASKWVALKGLELGIDDNTYSYIYANDANIAEDGSMTSTASAVYTFEACSGGFHIKSSNDGYLYQSPKYNNFYLTEDASKADVWTVEQQTEETFMVNNETVSKFMQFSVGYSSAGAYAAMQSDGVLPFLVPAKDPAPEIIKLETNTFSLGKEAGEFTVAATINADAVKVVTTASWLHYQGNDAGNLYFSYDSNNGGARTATVNITANLGASAADAKFTVMQKEGQGENPGNGGKYVKVTSAPADWSGKYLIVFGDNAHATISGKDLKETAAVTVSDNAIASSSAVDAAAVTVAKNGSKYSIALPDGKYFGMAHNSCASSEEPYDVDFEYTSDGIKIAGAVSGKTDTYYLYNNNGSYFRCYVDKTGLTGYSLPVLYKYAE